MINPLTSEFARLFHLRSTICVGVAAAVILAVFGLGQAALGVLIWMGQFVSTSSFLYEAGRSLFNASSARRGRGMAALSSVGRLAFLAVSLALVSRLGHSVLIASCGGLLFGQMNLHRAYILRERSGPCSNS